MPSDLAYWIVSVPLEDSDPHRMFSELGSKLLSDGGSASSDFGQLFFPPLKTGTLESLISLSEDLPKLDATYTQIVAKIIDTLRALLNNDETALAQHVLVNEQTLDDYMLSWSWNTGKYRADRGLTDTVEMLGKELNSIDNVMKQKLGNYNAAKGQLQQLQRKKQGNLSVRSLADVVHKEDFVDTNSEYLETLLVAVPKNNTKDWQARYERLTNMVVPRSSNKITHDQEFALFNVTVFKKVKDEFVQKCRENKFVVRTDFAWDDDLVSRQRQELDEAGDSEKELWTELLRLARTNFSEAYQALAHLKLVRTYVESVLRYGLPADYFAVSIRPNPKRTKALLQTLVQHYAYLESYNQSGNESGKNGNKKKKQEANAGDAPGEYAQLLEEEQFPFVLTEQYMVAV
ncbi:probable VMA5 - H+-ATPase V1 domain 42 KD subunit, vacuolar [Melanopsichium pennsylvanicum]|uniref:V-type proton ATPase subunit C n=2 Tax=Melanopsichium pennsylvanicum TaxID=63383 RepID=A0AAJ5C877_9BASI|nr:probable VMA5-H-ATPase V1 domain 42 KD subunit, vacuolar [Melanopsichium pennsylvanicum 4]SNX87691.1 probable VMA5 - H+-ATPase V1 domain 42 KD subunit, vacuolar [Melanopsichium pennsylvanicum]